MSFSELVCHLDAKGGKSSFVSGYFPTVQIYIAKIIDGTKIDKLPFSLPGLKVEIAFIPNAAFVKKQAVVLSVPVTGYLQARRCIEIVFYQIRRIGLFLITKETAPVDVHAIIVVTVVERIHYMIPRSVQSLVIAGVHILQDIGGGASPIQAEPS
jgi:hypothetical protein